MTALRTASVSIGPLATATRDRTFLSARRYSASTMANSSSLRVSRQTARNHGQSVRGSAMSSHGSLAVASDPD